MKNEKKIILISLSIIVFVFLILVISYRKKIENFNGGNGNIKLFNWWEKNDELSKKDRDVFEKIFKNTNTQNKNIKVCSVFFDNPVEKEANDLIVHFSGESHYLQPDSYDINLIPYEKTIGNIVPFLYGFYHVLLNKMNLRDFCIRRKYNIPKNKFCLFAVSNPDGQERNNFFMELSKYKRIDSCGKHLNNMGRNCPSNHNSSEYIDFISKYKFMICFENESHINYFTEKMINAYKGGTIPIYWGCKNVGDFINMDAILYLKPNYTENDVQKLIQQIAYLDNNEEAYKRKYEQPLFKGGKIPDEFNIFKLREKIRNIMDKKNN